MVTKKDSKRKFGAGTIITAIVLLLIVINIASSVVIPILIGVGILAGVAYLNTHYNRQKELAAAKRIQQLKEHIRQTDTGIKHLEQLQKDGAASQYLAIAEKLLPALDRIQAETEQLKTHLDRNIYRRISKHAQAATTDINKQVKSYKKLVANDKSPDFETILRKQAPELIKTYQNIQRDNKVILEKIKDADNKEELLALHQTSMDRFEDILRGYLKIKASPKDFYNAQERLEQAKTAMEQFDLDLDETLRQLNENDMTDFDISLRMMRDKL